MMAQPREQATPHSPAARSRSWRSLLLPALAAFAVLIALGTWQIERKAWKEALIAMLTERLAAPPRALASSNDWGKLGRASDEYRRVKFRATLDNEREALVFAAPSVFRPDVTSPGYWVFTPARLSDGNVVVVNRGFVPDARREPQSRPQSQIAEPIEITGALRWPDDRHWFTPADDPAHNLWFTRDPAGIATAKGLDLKTVAPFFVEQEAPTPPGGLPQPGKLVVSLPDNHLQYALTWYGLAAVLAAVFGFWAATAGRQPGPARQA
jgi:surfeit locus 1 family protein